MGKEKTELIITITGIMLGVILGIRSCRCLFRRKN